MRRLTTLTVTVLAAGLLTLMSMTAACGNTPGGCWPGDGGWTQGVSGDY